jgi:type IV pilus assembly protein PilC
MAHASTSKKLASPGFADALVRWWQQRSQPKPVRMKPAELAALFHNMMILLDAGLSLTQTLRTLADEETLRRHRSLLVSLYRDLEAGNSFSASLSKYPESFDTMIIQQITVAERTGDLGKSLKEIAKQVEESNDLRKKIIRKLSYPAVLIFAGGAVSTFMLMFVVPQYEKTYAESGAELPGITKVMLVLGNFLTNYGWTLPLIPVAMFFGLKAIRRNPAMSMTFDGWLIRIPVIGKLLRNVAAFEFINIFGNLLESGFTVAEALRVGGEATRNRAVRQRIMMIYTAVISGARLSTEIKKHSGLFPAMVRQLMSVGEKQGDLRFAIGHMREHLRKEIERTTAAMVGTIEPVATIGLASVIGGIVLAIYLPMFDLISATGSGH